jgi:hypothetical protein
MSFPRELLPNLLKAFPCRAFVETGTAHGETAIFARKHFPVVYTVEAEYAYYEAAWLATMHNHVHLFYGDSRAFLSMLRQRLQPPTMFWLDAHFSGEGTAGKSEECPVMGEILAIDGLRGCDVILIDDARMFLGVPPPPHDPEQWPTFDAIRKLVNRYEGTHLQVIGDVIVVTPRAVEL